MLSMEDDEIYQRERVLQERSRRSSIAMLLHDRARGEDEATFTPEYDDSDPNAVDPTNLASALEGDDMNFYHQMVQIESTQGMAAPASPNPLGSLFSPRPAMATGGDETTNALQSLMEHLIQGREEDASRRDKMTQKDCAALLASVPSVIVNGKVLKGSPLLAWFNELTATYLERRYWTSSYSFNATQSLFADAPELLATWRQTTQSDTEVLHLKKKKKWREAWDLVAASIVAAHVGDRLMALRKKVKAPQQRLQHGDKTVATTATQHLDEVQAARVLGLWDHFATLLHDLEKDERENDTFTVSILGLDLGSSDGMATHRHVLHLIRKYLDRQRALEFFGALRPEVQTYIENSDSGKKLLGSTADATFTWDEVRGLATEFETREQARDNDVARQLKKLGVDVPKQGKNGGRKARQERLTEKAKVVRVAKVAKSTDAPGAKAVSGTTKPRLATLALLLPALTARSTRRSNATAANDTVTSRRRTKLLTAPVGLLPPTAPSTTMPSSSPPVVRPLPLHPVR